MPCTVTPATAAGSFHASRYVGLQPEDMQVSPADLLVSPLTTSIVSMCRIASMPIMMSACVA